MRGLKDKAVIVTGGAGGIGSAICRRLAEEGAKVGVFDLRGEAADKVAAEIGNGASGHACDITDLGAVTAAVAAFEAKQGSTDALVNNAGWDKFAYFLDTTPEDWEKIIAINLKGPINLHHAVLKGMQVRRAGRVVNIASDAGRVGSSMEAVYSACKGGIIAFTKTMAREMARSNVTVNCVCPGPTETPLLQQFMGGGEQGARAAEGMKRAIPLKRLGQPDDLAGMVTFLASEDAAFITGQVVSVSGGLTMSG
ncbi:MAG: glucose 1-dehydrogenase [Hyphomicrobiaceae bacterium]